MFLEGGFVGQIRGQASNCHSAKSALTCGYAVFLVCPGRDLNPHGGCPPGGFKPPASTDSATRA